VFEIGIGDNAGFAEFAATVKVESGLFFRGLLSEEKALVAKQVELDALSNRFGMGVSTTKQFFLLLSQGSLLGEHGIGLGAGALFDHSQVLQVLAIDARVFDEGKILALADPLTYGENLHQAINGRADYNHVGGDDSVGTGNIILLRQNAIGAREKDGTANDDFQTAF